jgi:PAS domain S-box-containing protein
MPKQSTVKLRVLTAKKPVDRKMVQRSKRLNKETLQRLSHDLGERVKELNCLLGMSKLIEETDNSLEETIKGCVDLIPPAWQYPEITCARITLGAEEFKSHNFNETDWKLASGIRVKEKEQGTLEIYYLEEKPESYEGPFLKEERNLLNAIVERLGRFLERIQAKMALEESEERYSILANQVADGVLLVQDGTILFGNHSLASIFGYSDVNQVIGKMVNGFFGNDLKSRFHELNQEIESGNSKKGSFCGKCISQNGSEIWIENRFNTIKWKSKPAILGSIRDITKAKIKEIALKEEANQLRRENRQLRSDMKELYRFGSIVGKSSGMQKVYELITRTAKSEANVIILGESGTGKELVAKEIHKRSDRCGKPFVTVNCGAIPETLMESEFFGHLKGAFTGAHKDKQGLFDIADGGVLFLDEIGELDQNMQVKLLRAIDGDGYMPVGGCKTRRVDVRIIGATNKNLGEQIRKGAMREDFYYRIQVISITLPPLKNRKEDIPLLIDHFSKSYANGKKRPVIPGNILGALSGYNWPGNVRQLQNTLYRYFAVNQLDPLIMELCSFEGEVLEQIESASETDSLSDALEVFERKTILKILEKTHWQKQKAALELGVTRNTLYRKMKRFELH